MRAKGCTKKMRKDRTGLESESRFAKAMDSWEHDLYENTKIGKTPLRRGLIAPVQENAADSRREDISFAWGLYHWFKSSSKLTWYIYREMGSHLFTIINPSNRHRNTVCPAWIR